MTFKVGDICLLRPLGLEHLHRTPFKVKICGPGPVDDVFDFTVELIGDSSNNHVFHPCDGGPINFGRNVGRWVYASELSLVGRRVSRFGKFIRKCEEKDAML